MRVRHSFSSRHTRKLENIRKQREKYPSLLNSIIQNSDIILEVLDARFPEETRNFEIENEIKKKNKIIIYILNKSDLVEKEKLMKFKLYPHAAISCIQREGTKKLRDFIKRLSKPILKKKEKVFVGVIGYPNTGKSSLINALIGKSSARTASQAGFTKGIQKLRLAEKISLLDSPGVIPEKEYSSIAQEKITRHAIVGGRSYSQIKDPEIVAADLMKKYPGVLEKFYKIHADGDPEFLIENLGREKRFMKRGGEIDEDKTARFILKDWQEGKIRI